MTHKNRNLRNKKRNKKYQPGRWNESALFINRQALAELKETFTDIELAVETKLPYGKFTMHDVQQLRDFINLATALTYVGHRVDSDYVEELYGEEWTQLQNAFHTFYEKAYTKGCFTCNANELNAIRGSMDIAGHIVRDALDHNAHWTLQVFMGMKEITDGQPGRIEYDITELERKVLRARESICKTR